MTWRGVVVGVFIATGLLASASQGGAAGVFATDADLARAGSPARAVARTDFMAKLPRPAADPFAPADPDQILIGDPAAGPNDASLHGALAKLDRDSATMRDLAIAFALTGARRHARAAEAVMAAWATRGHAINFYDYDPDFATGTFRGMTAPGGGRDWHFGLNLMWQGYGLINAADAWLLLREAGHAPQPETSAAIEAWLRRLAAAVNSGLHAWSRWADARDPGAAGESGLHVRGDLAFADDLEMHRTTDHLSWGATALLAAAAALDDAAMAAYALDGGVWDDGRSGPYANPAPLRAMIDRAIEADGRIYEERIGRDPLIGYALFHLEALSLGARIAATRFDVDLWGFSGADGGGLREAYLRYAPFVDGRRTSPDPDEAGDVGGRWLAALSPPDFAGSRRQMLVSARPLAQQIAHVIGPGALLFEP